VRWFKLATGQATPLQAIYEKYRADKGQTLSQATLNDLKTAFNDFTDFVEGDVGLEEVDRRMVSDFAIDYLPNKATPKAPSGPGPATIRKKVTLLNSLWRWAMDRGYLEFSPMTPWDRQAPTAKALGDIIRVALFTGVRLEEVAGLHAHQLEKDGKGYEVKEGKSENATRYIR